MQDLFVDITGELVELKIKIIIRLSEIWKTLIIKVPLSNLELVAEENYSSMAL